MHHVRDKAVCDFLYKSRSCYLNYTTKGKSVNAKFYQARSFINLRNISQTLTTYWSQLCQVIAEQWFVGHCTRKSETKKRLSTFLTFLPFVILPVSEAQTNTSCRKKVSNAQKFRFGYFLASERYRSEIYETP